MSVPVAVVEIPAALLPIASKAAEAAFKRPVSWAEAVSFCINAQSDEAMKTVARTLNAKAKAQGIAMAVVAIQKLAGLSVELREADGEWWLAPPDGREGFCLGRCSRDALMAELAKLDVEAGIRH